MRFRFRAFAPGELERKERFERLQAIYDQLLLQLGGDADQAMTWMERLGRRYSWFDEDYGFEDFKRDLLADGRVTRREGPGGGFVLSARGERLLREEALERIFESLAAGGLGDHASRRQGGIGETTGELRPWRQGDEVADLAWTETFGQAMRATGRIDPGAIGEDHLLIREREQLTGCATVLLIDVSHSMVLYGEDRMTPAREVALALFELIRRQYKKDTLDLVLFGDEARQVPLEKIPYIQAGPFHTNTKAGLQLAQRILRGRRHVNKQIFMVTDGKPSCIERDGRLYKNPFGLDEEVVNRTLDEALRCRRDGIRVTTFMLAEDPMLVRFVEEFTELARGRAYFTGTGGLAQALFVDYLRNRRSRL